jgi:LPS export ABC transporter protein LptC
LFALISRSRKRRKETLPFTALSLRNKGEVLFYLIGGNVSRAQVRFVIGGVVLLLFSVIGYYFWVNVQTQRQQQEIINRIADDLTPGTDQRMKDLRRFKVRDGQKVWEIAARQARYLGETGEVVVDDPEVSLYFDDGEAIALRCREGLVQLNVNEQEIIKMELKGNLEMQFGDLSLRAQEAIYEKAPNTISSPGPIQVTGPDFVVEGQGYTIEVAQKRLTLNSAVHTTLTTREG